jgi:small conductance mechanosensitive channel
METKLSEAVNELVTDLVLFLPQLVVSLVIFFLTLVAASLATELVQRGLKRRHVTKETELLIGQVVRWTILIAGTVSALQQVNFELTAFLAGLGIVGFTVGFALQDVSKNFVSGLLLLLEQPFSIGEAVKVSDFSGKVENISLRTTEIRTWDGILICIPNADVFTRPIVNYSRAPRRRLELNAGVSYDSDLSFVERTALQTILEVPGVVADPPPQVIFNNLGPSTVDFTLYYWVDVSEIGFLDATDAGITGIKGAFEQAGIDMPYPTQTLNVRQMTS